MLDLPQARLAAVQQQERVLVQRESGVPARPTRPAAEDLGDVVGERRPQQPRRLLARPVGVLRAAQHPAGVVRGVVRGVRPGERGRRARDISERQRLQIGVGVLLRPRR